MSVDETALITKVEQLDDLEVAVLLSIVANEHCLVEAPPEGLDATEAHIKLIADELFGLSSASVDCSESTTVDEFTSSLLRHSPSAAENGHGTRGLVNLPSPRSGRHSPHQPAGLGNVIIAKNLGSASRQVQTQALELLRTGRIFTHTDVYAAPRPFLFIALDPISGPRLFDHLNDLFFISHFHEPDSHSEYHGRYGRKSKGKPISQAPAGDMRGLEAITETDIKNLVSLRQHVTTTIEVKRYMHDIVVFLRMHRAVASGVTPKATRHFETLSECLAPCNGLGFVSPALVVLAARKIYRHRLRLVTVQEERSMQYGSDPRLVADYLRGLTPELVIEEVLEEIEVPV